MHESGSGTYRTCRANLTMSVDRGKADLALEYVEVLVVRHQPASDLSRPLIAGRLVVA